MVRGASARDRLSVEMVLRRLIAARSPNPPGDERAMAQAIEACARELRLPRPRIHARNRRRPNLVFELGHGSPTLLLGAHTDTVPVDDLDQWATDPFVLAKDDGRYVGLGVADMKGAIAAMLVAGARLASRLRTGRLLLAFTADEEEASGHGMEWLCQERRLEADAAVLLEPGSISERSWDALYRAQRGSCVVRLRAHGRAGHSGDSRFQDERAGRRLVAALAALTRADVFGGHRHPIDGTPPVVNAPTMLFGGSTPWSHPGHLEAVIEIRTLPAMAPGDVMAELRRVMAGAGVGDHVELELQSWGPPGPVVGDDAVLAAARDALAAIGVTEPADAVFPASTDSTHLTDIGIPTLPALGPGSLAVSHQPNEWVPVADLPRAVRLIETLTASYLQLGAARSA